MRELSLEEIRKIQLDILKDVAAFCEKNNLDYFISCGTLLGSVRHKGFIPWDDDLDITMPRDSYEKFISTYSSDRDFKVATVYKNMKYAPRFARVMSMQTSRSTRKTSNFDMRVCIDVFPMDFFDSIQQAEDIYRHLFPSKNNAQGRIKKSVPALLKRAILKQIIPFLANCRSKAKDRYVRHNCGNKENYVSVILAPTEKMPEVFKYSEIFPTRKEGLFEGHTFRVPNNSDKYLSALYGDYMNPPPADKQKPSHYKEAYLS